VGGGYGAALAKAGADVTFIARGAHLAAMKGKGLQGRERARRHAPRATQATDDPKTVGPVDVVLFCVKLWESKARARRSSRWWPRYRGHSAAERVDASERLARSWARRP